MAGLLTNNGAMVALQTLRGINIGLERTQDAISTGKSISTARSNAAVWSISKVMESDVKGFKEVTESLRMGSATLAVGRSAAEAVTRMLGDIKVKIVQANEENIDRAKVHTDFEGLREQVQRIVASAQFNGLSMLQNTSATEGEGSVDFLGSLNRLSPKVVQTVDITVAKRDLGTDTQTVGTAATDAGIATTVTAGDQGIIATFASTSIVAGQSFQFDATQLGGAATISYVAREGDSLSDINNQMAARINFHLAENGVEDVAVGVTRTNAHKDSLILENNSDADITTDTSVGLEDLDGDAADGTIGGGLELLNSMDLSTATGASAALSAIDWLVQVSVDAAASFGSSQGRLEKQSSFVSTITDTLKSGIGSMVDADMEANSARLQALQVQQQLAVQALSIANQQPQQLLSLFR